MDPVILLHYWLGVLLIAINLTAGIWGLIVWRGRAAAGRTYGHVLALSQTVIIGQAVIGLLLLSSDLRAPEQLHYVYGLLPAALVVFAYSARGSKPQRNILIFSIAALLAAALAVRAFSSAGALG